MSLFPTLRALNTIFIHAQDEWLDDKAMCGHLDESSAFLGKLVRGLQTQQVSEQLTRTLADNADVAIDAMRNVIESADYDKLQELNQAIHRLMHK